MDRDALLALGEHLKQFITFTEGPRIGMILPQLFKSDGCDHTFAKTKAWLEANGHDVEKSIRRLKERGGDCDCKVIMNVIWHIDDEL